MAEENELLKTAGMGLYHCDPRWQKAVCDGLSYKPYLLRREENGELLGFLPLAYVKSALFGKFLVSLPYLNTGGVVSHSTEVARSLIDEAVELADSLDVKYLELRHEVEVEHPKLRDQLTSKVHMRLDLPESDEELWDGFKAKVRNQIRKGEKNEFEVRWGGMELLDDYYSVFSQNMRDLGTPVYGRQLFASIIDQLEGQAELCVIHNDKQPIGCSLIVHSPFGSEVPSASTLRSFNKTNVNMLMYWNMLKRSIEKKAPLFDFGRSTRDSNTYRFKKQWGATEAPAVWQYYVRKGSVGDMRRESGKYATFIKVWQKLPLWLTRLIGPTIVRGIP